MERSDGEKSISLITRALGELTEHAHRHTSPLPTIRSPIPSILFPHFAFFPPSSFQFHLRLDKGHFGTDASPTIFASLFPAFLTSTFELSTQNFHFSNISFFIDLVSLSSLLPSLASFNRGPEKRELDHHFVKLLHKGTVGNQSSKLKIKDLKTKTGTMIN